MKIGPAVRPGYRIEKKGKGSQKSHNVVILRLFGEKRPVYRLKPKFVWWVISYAKFKSGILMGTILQGVEFPIFLLIFAWALQQCSATALPVM